MVVMLASVPVLGCSHISDGGQPRPHGDRERKLREEVESLQAAVQLLRRTVEKEEGYAKIGKPLAEVQEHEVAAREKAYRTKQRIRDLEAMKEILTREYDSLEAQIKVLQGLLAAPY